LIPPGSVEAARPAILPADLAHFDDLYRALGRFGWSPGEVDAMEVWTAASFVGVPDRDPILRGSRSIHLSSDGEQKGTTTAGGQSYVPPPRDQLPDPETWGRDNPADAAAVLRGAGGN
jgi:hypothetical protein